MTPVAGGWIERIAAHLSPGCLVAVGDGAGMPLAIWEPLRCAARMVGGVRLLLGWCLTTPPGIEDERAFLQIDAILGGYGLRTGIREGRVNYLPVRLGSLPALLQGPLRPDVIITSLRPDGRIHGFGSEMGWLPSAMDAAATVMVEERPNLPASAAAPVERTDLVLLGCDPRGPIEFPVAPPTPRLQRLGEQVAAMIRPGAVLQFGPGGVGAAALAALDVPVEIDSGVLTDDVVDLHERGLLLGDPVSTYLVGTQRLYRWANGRALLRGVAYTHDLSRLSDRPLIAINTALEIDRLGQVNVEGMHGDVIAGIGGHPDYSLAASRSSTGLSVLALPTIRGGRRTLVDQLAAPVSTTRSDIDLLVTEHGTADLRGRCDRERTQVIEKLWEE